MLSSRYIVSLIFLSEFISFGVMQIEIKILLTSLDLSSPVHSHPSLGQWTKNERIFRSVALSGKRSYRMINHDYDYNETNPANFSIIYHLTVPRLFSLYEQPVSAEALDTVH